MRVLIVLVDITPSVAVLAMFAGLVVGFVMGRDTFARRRLAAARHAGFEHGRRRGLDEGYLLGRKRETAWWAEVDYQVETLKSTHTEEP